MPNIRIPDIVKHCTIAIYREGGVTARNAKDRFIQAFKIAKARLAQYGFVQPTGESLSAPIGLTPKGRAREAKHNREGRAKTVLFDTLYDKFDVDGSRAKAQQKLKEKAAEAIAAQEDAPSPAKKKKTPGTTPPKPTRKNKL